MNSLSWFIYLSEVVGSFKTGLGVIGFLSVATGAFFLVGQFIEGLRSKVPAAIFFTGLASLTVSGLLPSKDTMRYIAASEFGQRVIESERVQGIIDPGLKYVEQWLKEKTEKKDN